MTGGIRLDRGGLKMEDDFAKMVSSYLPSSFGKAKPKEDMQSAFLKSKRPVAEQTQTNEGDEDEITEEDNANDEPLSSYTLPITHEARIEQHTKSVSCVDVDHSGARMVTGGYDHNIGYYDFGGMDSDLQPFRYVNPDGAYKIKALRFSKCSQWLLTATSSNKPLLMDRNGSKVRSYTDGDLYIRDLKNTNGHVAALSTCYWNPVNPDQFMTSAADGTVRLWNIGYSKRQDYVIVVKGRKATGRSPVTHARYSNDGSTILTGSEDGALRLYSSKGPWNFPDGEILGAHTPGSEITCLALDQSTGHLVTSRATDGTLKLWDMRNWKAPIASASGLPNFCSETACVISPDDKLVVTGTSAKKGEEWGKLVFLSLQDNLKVVHTMEELSKSSVIGLSWPSSLNQIITGNGDGSASLLYDPTASKKGALLPMVKAPKVREPAIVSESAHGRIITPHALPMFRETEGRSLKRSKIKARKDPLKSHLPTLPIDGPGQGGRLGSGITQAIMKDRLPSASTRDQDPREALLKYAKVAEENPMFITPAYQHTQPKAVLDPSLLEKERQAELKKQADKEALAKLLK